MFNEYSFLEVERAYGRELERIYVPKINIIISLSGYNFPEWICFPWTRIYFLEWTDKLLEMNVISWKNIIASNDYTFCE